MSPSSGSSDNDMRQEESFAAWLKTRSATSQRFMRFGRWALLFAMSVGGAQFCVWAVAGWGSANFMPLWSLVPIYVVAILAGLSVFYFMVAHTAHLEGKVIWPTSFLAGLFTVIAVVGTLAGSLPQISTLIVSRPMERELVIHKSHDSRFCRGSVSFGPSHFVRGSMCTGFPHWPVGHSQVFQGYGNALAMRIEDY